jgi:hypothetical protein
VYSLKLRATPVHGIKPRHPTFPSPCHGDITLNLKENFVPIAPAAILKKIDALPLTEWNYRNEDPSVRHIGPIAQDFFSIFRVGNSSTSISTIDPSGIALAGVQALDEKTHARAVRLAELKKQLEAKTEEIHLPQERLARLESLLEQTRSGVKIRQADVHGYSAK